MKKTTQVIVFILIGLTIALSGCGGGRMGNSISVQKESDVAGLAKSESSSQDMAVAPGKAKRASPSAVFKDGGRDVAREREAGQEQPESQIISLDSAAASEAQAEITDRKIIRNAELTIEISDPSAGLQKIASIAEKNGGFVVTSESKENDSQNLPASIVTVVARVPAAQFDAAIDAIRRIAGRIKAENISGMDVTEEYIDIEARIRTKRALELQFLEIMRQARKISDALEVQNQLAEVRTEIESLEGRRRFLANKSALSTISITLQTPAPLLVATTSGFGNSVKLAFGDGVDIALGILLGIIRLALAMIPITVFIILPCWFLYSRLRRYFPLTKSPASPVVVTDQGD